MHIFVSTWLLLIVFVVTIRGCYNAYISLYLVFIEQMHVYFSVWLLLTLYLVVIEQYEYISLYLVVIDKYMHVYFSTWLLLRKWMHFVFLYLVVIDFWCVRPTSVGQRSGVCGQSAAKIDPYFEAFNNNQVENNICIDFYLLGCYWE